MAIFGIFSVEDFNVPPAPPPPPGFRAEVLPTMPPVTGLFDAPILSPSNKAISLIQQQEGCVLTAMKDVDGVYVIGYGCKFVDGQPVHEGQVIDTATAIRAMTQHAQEKARDILASVHRHLKQGELDALVDFAYNAGTGAFQQSTILKSINANQPVTEDMFTRWNKIHKDGQLVELPALTTRRKLEYQLFIS